jgi:uncharacterized RDD family membrane protein YckC
MERNIKVLVLKCPNCDFEIQDEAKFCSNCGSSIEQSKIKEAETAKVEELKPLYCRNCGTQLVAGAIFCSSCGTSVKGPVKSLIAVTDWGKRFLAWLIDIIILGFVLTAIRLPGYVLIPELSWVPFVDLGANNLIYFLYWMFMEGIYGQSLGKMVMKIKVTKLDGKPVNLPYAAIESIGKAFLLPIDCIIGWLLYKDKNQRLFNYLSETIVVKA